MNARNSGADNRPTGGGRSPARRHARAADARTLDQILMRIEKREILSALERAKGQRSLAAEFLGISRSRLYRRMEALGIDPRDVESRDT